MTSRWMMFVLIASSASMSCRAGERRAAPDAVPPAGSAARAQPAASLSSTRPAASAPGRARSAPRPPGDGRLPIDFPEIATSARAGDRVLAPPMRWVAEALERGLSAQPLAFYGAQMLEPGERASWIHTELGDEENIPNALIIPLPRGARAAPGDVVLTADAAGAGMQRALVVAGGAPERPRVRPLDVPLERAPEVELPPDSFLPLRSGEVGSAVQCEQDKQRTRWIVLSIAQDRLLGLGFAGKLQAFARAQCSSLPLVPELEAGAHVEVPVLGVYTPAAVERVDADTGRVRVTVPRGHGRKELTVPFGDVTRRLD